MSGVVATPNLPAPTPVGTRILEFDGDCGFCTKSARWIERRLPASSGVTVAPWQQLDLDALRLTRQDVTDAAWFIEPDGTRRRGHLAIAAALRAIGGAWAVVGRVLTWPVVSQVGAVVYRLVSRYRYRLPGSTPACKVP